MGMWSILEEGRGYEGFNERGGRELEMAATFLVNNDMTVEIQLAKRKNDNSTWKYNRNFNIGEEFVTIL